jgi:hypothetical protein
LTNNASASAVKCGNRDGGAIGLRFVPGMASPAHLRRPTGRTNRLDIEPQSLDASADERAQLQLVPRGGVRTGTGLRVNRLAIRVYGRPQALNTVLCGTNLEQNLDPTAIGNAVFALNRVPELATGSA